MPPQVQHLIDYALRLWHSGELWWVALGFLSQGVFFVRFFIQWLSSEREKKSVVPPSFWYASLAAGLLLLSYAIHLRDVVLILGQAAGALIYLRNIIFIHGERKRSLLPIVAVLVAGALLVAAGIYMPGAHEKKAVQPSVLWVVFGLVAQTVFFLRFVVQWLASELEKKSVMPNAFWHLSLAGGLMILAYVVHLRDPVFIVGQGTGVFIYLRNIMLIHGARGRDFSYVVILVLVSSLLFGLGTDVPALWSSSEARSAQIAREMYETGNYVVPHLDGKVWLTKPPLYHWLAALSYSAFGVNEFAARLPSSVAGILAIVAIFVLGRRMFGATAAFLAALMTASSIEFVWNARCARTDMLYTFLVVSAVTAFVYAADSARRRKDLYLLSFGLMGLAFMAKGPAGLFLPLVSGAGYLWFTGRRSHLRTLPWLACCAVFLAIVLPWHLSACLSVSPHDRNYFLWGQLARWSMGQGEDSPQSSIPLSFALYVPYFIKGFFPWSFLLPAGAVLAIRRVHEKGPGSIVMPLVWFVAGLASFSFAGTRASRYMVPVLPAAAMMVAFLWQEASSAACAAGAPGAAPFRWLKWSLWPLVVAGVAASAVVASAPGIYASADRAGILGMLNSFDAFMAGVWASFLGSRPWLFGIGAGLFAVSALAALVAVYRAKLSYAFGLMAAVVVGFLCLLQFALMPEIDRIYNVKPFVARLDRLSNGGPYAWIGNGSLETLFYMGRPFDTLHAADVESYLAEDPRALVLVWDSDLDHLPEGIETRTKVLMRERLKHREAIVLAPLSRPPENRAPAPG